MLSLSSRFDDLTSEIASQYPTIGEIGGVDSLLECGVPEHRVVESIYDKIMEALMGEAEMFQPYDVYRGEGTAFSSDGLCNGELQSIQVDFLISRLCERPTHHNLCVQIISRVRMMAVRSYWDRQWDFSDSNTTGLNIIDDEFASHFRTYLGPTVKRHTRYLRLLEGALATACHLETSRRPPISVSSLRSFINDPLVVAVLGVVKCIPDDDAIPFHFTHSENLATIPEEMEDPFNVPTMHEIPPNNSSNLEDELMTPWEEDRSEVVIQPQTPHLSPPREGPLDQEDPLWSVQVIPNGHDVDPWARDRSAFEELLKVALGIEPDNPSTSVNRTPPPSMEAMSL